MKEHIEYILKYLEKAIDNRDQTKIKTILACKIKPRLLRILWEMDSQLPIDEKIK